MMHTCVMMTNDLGGSPCLGACPRSDGRESTLVTSSCRSSLCERVYLCASSSWFSRVSLFCGSLGCLSSHLGCWILLSVFRVCSCGFVLFGAMFVDVSSSSLSRPPLPFGSSAFACKTHPPSRTSLRSFTTGVPLAEESVLSFLLLAS